MHYLLSPRRLLCVKSLVASYLPKSSTRMIERIESGHETKLRHYTPRSVYLTAGDSVLLRLSSSQLFKLRGGHPCLFTKAFAVARALVTFAGSLDFLIAKSTMTAFLKLIYKIYKSGLPRVRLKCKN